MTTDPRDAAPTICSTGKRKYATKRIAGRAAAMQRHRKVRPYECAMCGHWHLGHRNRHDKTVEILRESKYRRTLNG